MCVYIHNNNIFHYHFALCIQAQTFDPNHVGNSIKALALSVQDTSMFGELPRPRMKSSSYARKW